MTSADRGPRRRALALLPAAAAAVAVVVPAQAHGAPTPKKIYACVTQEFSTLNLTTKNGRCPSGQLKISWNVEGTTGQRGPRGPRGDAGPRGERGPQGADGASGPQGQAGPGGPVGPAGAQGAAGPVGPVGPVGADGADGAVGPQGPAGSPDTPAEVLAKLLQVDGPGSGIDAEFLAGQPATAFQQRVTGTCPTGSYVREVAADGTVACEQALVVPLRLVQTTTTGGVLDAALTNPASTATAVSVRQQGIGNGIDVELSNAGSGGRALSIDNRGVGPGIYANTAGGNSIWGVVNSISAAAVIGDSSSGEAVVARQNGAICERNIGRCNGIGAVVGRHDGTGGYGVRGFVTDPNGAIGVIGQSGISGGTGTGVRAENVNAANNDNALEAVTNGNGSALFAQGRTTAATFNGAVQINGDLTVTGTKSGFRIDDPRAPGERTLTHTPLETDALKVTYGGNVTTGSDGRATVALPAYAIAIAGDWSYQLTPIGRFGQAIVSREVDGEGRFTIATEHPSTKVSWSVVGVRKDPQARRDGIAAVQSKSGRTRNRYIDPSLYGKPAARAITPGIKPTTGGARAASGRPKLASER